MIAFATKEHLVAAYAKTLPNLHKQFHNDAAKYVPHLYRGGFVIRGFGFSIERIGKHVSKDNCGNPALV